MPNRTFLSLLITLILFASTACGGGGGDGGASCVNSGGCGPGEFCSYSNFTCGQNEGSGQCQPVPISCDALLAPVCSCAGLSFFNECLAQSGGQSVRSNGECA